MKDVNPTSVQRNLKAIKKIRSRQFSPMTFFGSFTGIWFLILAFDGVPWMWEAIIIGAAGQEVIGNFFLEFFFKGRRSDPVNKITNQDENYPNNREDKKPYSLRNHDRPIKSSQGIIASSTAQTSL